MTLGLAEVTCPHLTKMQDITATDHKKAATAPYMYMSSNDSFANVGYQQKATSKKLPARNLLRVLRMVGLGVIIGYYQHPISALIARRRPWSSKSQSPQLTSRGQFYRRARCTNAAAAAILIAATLFVYNRIPIDYMKLAKKAADLNSNCKIDG